MIKEFAYIIKLYPDLVDKCKCPQVVVLCSQLLRYLLSPCHRYYILCHPVGMEEFLCPIFSGTSFWILLLVYPCIEWCKWSCSSMINFSYSTNPKSATLCKI